MSGPGGVIRRVSRTRRGGKYGSMSKRIDSSWVVFNSIENDAHNRCVDLFQRPDGTFGFEEFRADVEDAGAWTPVGYYSVLVHSSKEAALNAAINAVAWLAAAIRDQ